MCSINDSIKSSNHLCFLHTREVLHFNIENSRRKADGRDSNCTIDSYDSDCSAIIEMLTLHSATTRKYGHHARPSALLLWNARHLWCLWSCDNAGVAPCLFMKSVSVFDGHSLECSTSCCEILRRIRCSSIKAARISSFYFHVHTDN
jgi:hypothetical protein